MIERHCPVCDVVIVFVELRFDPVEGIHTRLSAADLALHDPCLKELARG